MSMSGVPASVDRNGQGSVPGLKARRPSTARRRPLAVLGTVGVTLAVAACGSSSGGAASSSSAASSANALDSKTAQQLFTAAKNEGSVTWYTTVAADDVKSVVDVFNKTYPGIKVNTIRLSADKIPPRVLTEQRGGKYNADVVTGNSSYTAQLIQAGAYQPYQPPDAAPLPAQLDLPKGYQTITYVTTTVIAWNPAVLKQKGLTAPTSFADLTKPEWKGHFSIDPGAVNLYDAMIEAKGHDAALKVVQGLGNNDPKFVESHTEAVTQVQAGEPVATATAYGYKASSLKKKTPGQLDFINPNPLPTGADLIDIAKNAPHPNAARLFLDWVTSQPGQKEIEDVTNHTSLRSDVPNDPAVWDPAKFPPVYSHANLPADTFNKYLAEYKAALKAP
jgi:iron(III) transport system substrate-binding protein